MIIWGTRGITSTKGGGSFFCPKCEESRPYIQRRLRRWFTLYFIPLIPMDLVGEYIQCSQCKGQFKPEVLKLDPAAKARELTARLNTVAAGAMIGGAAAAGLNGGPELETLRQDLAQTTSMELTQGQLRERLAGALGLPAAQIVAPVARSINEQGKELVFRSALTGALCAGADLSQAATDFLNELAEAMHMAASHVRGIMAETHEQP